MDRDLRIRMLLEAGDRASRPLRDIANGGSRAAQALKATRDRLKDIEAAQADVAGFRQLKTGLRTTAQAMQTAQTRIGQLSREIAQTEAPTRAMTRDLAKARQEAQRLTRQHDAESQQLQQLRDRLRAAGVSTSDLARHERELRASAADTNRELEEQTRRLGIATDRQRRFGAARERFARTQNMATGLAAGGAAAIGTGVAMGTGIWRGVKAAQEYESTMTDIAQKANLSRVEAEKMGRGLLVASKAANQLPAELQAGVDTLAGFGLDPRQAVAMMTPIGRAATAYKAEIADLSAAAFAANDNLKVPVAQTARVIDIMAQAGKSGAFEIKDMAGAFPALTAGYQALGQTGTGAVADLAAALQIARKGAGDSATAATNVANIIQKISSPATIKAFSKFGIDLPAALKRAYAEGRTPLEAIAELTKKATGGDLGKIGFLFEDAQVQQGLRPLIQNMEEYRRIRTEAAGASGVTDTDFAERLKDSAEQSKKLEINAKALGIAMGSVLLPTVNAITARAAEWANGLADLTQRHPVLAKAVGIGALALAAMFLVIGGGAIALAGIMLPIAAINAGLVAMGVAGGIASIGLLPIIGTVAAVVAGIALFAGAAYLLYNNWGAITGFFGNLWAGVKSVFSMSLFDIYSGIEYFIGYALGSLFRFGSTAFGWLTGTLPGLFVSGWNAAWSAFKAALTAAFVTLPRMFYDFGAMIIQGLWNGIKSAPGRLWSAGKALAGSLARGFKDGAQIRSPSRVFMALGGHIVGGLNLGLDRGHDGAVDRVARLTRNMAAAAALPTLAINPSVTAAEAFAARSADIRITGVGSRQQVADPRTAGASGSGNGRGTAPAAPLSVSITINPPAGAAPQDIATAVRRELERFHREQIRTAASTFADTPDWI